MDTAHGPGAGIQLSHVADKQGWIIRVLVMRNSSVVCSELFCMHYFCCFGCVPWINVVKLHSFICICALCKKHNALDLFLVWSFRNEANVPSVFKKAISDTSVTKGLN